MSRFILFIFLLSTQLLSLAQTPAMDSLKKAVAEHPQKDTIRVNRLNQLGFEARKSTSQVSYDAYMEALDLARKMHYRNGEGIALLGLGFYYRFIGETKLGLDYTLQAVPVFRELKDTLSEISCYYNLTVSYSRTANFDLAMKYGMEGVRLAELTHDPKWLVLSNYQMGNLYMNIKEDEKGEMAFRNSFQQAEMTKDIDGMAHAYGGIAWVYERKKMWDSAIYFYTKQLELSKKMNDPRGVLQNELDIVSIQGQAKQYDKVFARIYYLMDKFEEYGQVGYLPGAYSTLAEAHLNTGHPDSTIYYANKAVTATKRSGRVTGFGFLMRTIAQAYANQNNFEKAFEYQQRYTNYMDSLNLSDALKRVAALQYSFELDKKESQISLLKKNEELTARQNRQQKILLAGTLIGLIVVLVFIVILWRNNKEKHRAYLRLEQQQEQLKQTQTQLIQSEKMASLGELTAGIAHEIQNPLNFVNNFSEVNRELLTEMKDEIEKKNYSEVADLANDVIANEEKINYHGKRADAIVKSMLQHSRTNSGQKELADINALVDECLRLSFHGMRARDKSFNVKMDTSLQADLPKLKIVEQDIGRVLLNLFTNAFYSMAKKKQENPDDYEPLISIRTEKQGNNVIISVRDNGKGIPGSVIEKIFQPFFTTKPTGEGTGLGLSMSFDIIQKGHGGQLLVDSKEGQYAEFKIILPQ